MRRLVHLVVVALALTSLVLAGDVEADQSELVQSVERARKHDDAELLAALNELAAFQSKQGDVALALTNYKEALECTRRIEDSRGSVEASRNIARLFRYLGQYGDAIEQLSIALDEARAIAAEAEITEILHDIGKVYSDSGDPLLACEFHEEALLRMEQADAPGLYRILINLGVVQTGLGEFGLAIAHYERARELAEEAVEGPDAISAGTSAGIANIALADDARAIKFLLPPIAFYREQDNKPKLCAALMILGVAYEGTGQEEKALETYNEARLIGVEIQEPGLEINARVALARLHSSRGDHQAAYLEAKQYLELDRGRKQLDQQQALAEFRAKFGAREQLLTIGKLEGQARVADFRIKQTQQQRMWLAIFTSVVLTAAILLALLSRSRHKVHTKLSAATRDVEIQRDKLAAALERAAALRGQLPICSCCNRIQNDAGAWTRLESFVHSQTGAKFTHSICPTCIQEQFPELDS